MSSKHKLFQGAMILTAAGFITRVMGFFFRIFLSHAFGEENVGLYQLVFPVYALCISLSTAGIQTAVSRMVAGKVSLGRQKEAKSILYTALSLTLLLSFAEVILVQQNAPFIAETFLGDIRCTQLLVIISYALPCAAVHSCICGYSFGLQKAALPAVSQLIEQVIRILFVFSLFLFMKQSGRVPSVQIAAAGIVAGEFASALFSSRFLSKQDPASCRPAFSSLVKNLRELLSLSVPLTANRTAVTLLQSVEAASIPACLKLSGMDTSEALSMYGVLTGMALPCILFPSAITNSVGTVLMPAVSAAQASGDRAGIARLLKKAVGSCLILGLSSCLFFLIFGNLFGTVLFHSSSAGKFILTLAWICPFMYTNTALMSAINGLGKTTFTFLINTAGLLVRIAGVFLAIPDFGIQGYLWSLLVSQLAVSALAFLVLLTQTRSHH
ncbi:MAG TPA: polysaccharide biosynthesis protein [Candidatus Mediterraneibacter merdavium]|nr:polysaccharide biosynthesis protein [Candidatus Mediterraneibacter merdavium]